MQQLTSLLSGVDMEYDRIQGYYCIFLHELSWEFLWIDISVTDMFFFMDHIEMLMLRKFKLIKK